MSDFDEPIVIHTGGEALHTFVNRADADIWLADQRAIIVRIRDMRRGAISNTADARLRAIEDKIDSALQSLVTYVRTASMASQSKTQRNAAHQKFTDIVCNWYRLAESVPSDRMPNLEVVPEDTPLGAALDKYVGNVPLLVVDGEHSSSSQEEVEIRSVALAMLFGLPAVDISASALYGAVVDLVNLLAVGKLVAGAARQVEVFTNPAKRELREEYSALETGLRKYKTGLEGELKVILTEGRFLGLRNMLAERTADNRFTSIMANVAFYAIVVITGIVAYEAAPDLAKITATKETVAGTSYTTNWGLIAPWAITGFLVVWVLRVLRQLANRADSRAQEASFRANTFKTFSNLLKDEEAKPTPQERALIYEALFRPEYPENSRDDGMPKTIAQSIVENVTGKGRGSDK